MKATIMTLGLVGVLLGASAEGCSGSSAGGDASDGGGSGGSSGSSSGGADGSSGADTSYCVFERSGVSRCAGWAGLGSGACDAVHGGENGADAGSYDTTCSSSSMACPNTPLICQKFSFGSGAINGYACTQTCSSMPDCLAPGDPAVQCVPFTTGHFCVITCDASSTTNTCPGSAKCTADPGNVGICVSS